MYLQQMLSLIEGELVVSPDSNVDVTYVFASDLMSDVLVYANTDGATLTSTTLMVTGLSNPQTIRTAEMADIPAILFVRGKYPAQQTVELATESGIALLVAPYTMFETCGLLYQAGMKGIGKVRIVQQR